MGDDFLRNRLGLQSRPVNPGAGERGDVSCEQHVAQATNLGA
jgi:hypothetical protein